LKASRKGEEREEDMERQSEEVLLRAVERIGEAVFPERISLGDIRQHLGGYNKARAVKQLVEAASQDPLITRLKLHMVYAELKRLFDNGGF